MRKRFFIFHAVPAAIFVGLVFGLVFVKSPASAQMVTRTVKSSPVRPAAPARTLSVKFRTAAVENTRLRSELTWTFGGKTQTGWAIYEPLISATIGATTDASSPEFAAALSEWQASQGIDASGILDEPTLDAFTRFWQSRRLGRSDSPDEDRLLSAPIIEFYDPTRSPDLLKLERETFAAYKKMIAAASKDLSKEVRFTRDHQLAPGEKFLRIVSAYRSPEYQAELRRKQPNASRAALAVHSPHNTGQALDLYVGGEPVSTKDANRMLQVQTPAYKWLVNNAHRFGFYPYFYEPWHWEYVGNKK